MNVFPVVGPSSFTDDFGAPRSGGRSHAGVDIWADRGLPVVSVADGWATKSDGGLGGRGVNVTTKDGTRFYYAHLDTWAGEFPRAVAAGETIGTVGNSGNAANGPTHLHFEIHPQGGEPVNPVPLLQNLPGSNEWLTWTPKPAPKPKAAPKSDEFGAIGLLFLIFALASRKRR